MDGKRKYEILAGFPPFGNEAVVSVGGQPNYSEGYVVRFFKEDGNSWIANFAKGMSGFSGIYPHGEGNLLIFAGGKGYLMNPSETKPIKEFGYAYNYAGTAENGTLVLSDYTNITMLDPSGNLWVSKQISWDGFKDLVVSGNELRGFSYNPAMRRDKSDEWIPFTLNLDTKKLKGGSYSQYGPPSSPRRVIIRIAVVSVVFFVMCMFIPLMALILYSDVFGDSLGPVAVVYYAATLLVIRVIYKKLSYGIWTPLRPRRTINVTPIKNFLDKYPWMGAVPFVLIYGMFIAFDVSSHIVEPFSFLMFSSFSLYFYNERKKRKYFDEEEYLWYTVIWAIPALVAGWTAIALNFNHFLPWMHRVPSSLSAVIGFVCLFLFFQTPNIVYKSWVGLDVRIKEFIEFAIENVRYREEKKNKESAETFQKVYYAFLAIRNKDKQLESLVPLLDHKENAVRSWTAIVLLKSNPKYEEKCLNILKELSEKEGYLGEAAIKVLGQWQVQKDAVTT